VAFLTCTRAPASCSLVYASTFQTVDAGESASAVVGLCVLRVCLVVHSSVVVLHSDRAAVVAGILSARWLPLRLVEGRVRCAAAGLNLQVGNNRHWLGAHDERAAAYYEVLDLQAVHARAAGACMNHHAT